MRKYSKNKVYSGNLTCFAYKRNGHFASKYPFKKQLSMCDNKNAILVKAILEDLLDVTSNMSDNESVYSIIFDDLSFLIFELDLSLDSTFLDTILSNG